MGDVSYLNGVRRSLLLDPLDDGFRVGRVLVVDGRDVVLEVDEGRDLVDAVLRCGSLHLCY